MSQLFTLHVYRPRTIMTLRLNWILVILITAECNYQP